MTTSSEPAYSHDVASRGHARSRAGRAALERMRPGMLLAFRGIVTILFLLHPITSIGLGAALTVGAIVQIVTVLLVAVGLFARPAAFLLSGMMAFTYFLFHVPQGWSWIENGGESAALYSWIFLLLFVLGPGSYSIDRRRTGDRITD